MNKQIYIECSCCDSSHILRLTKDEDGFYIETQLNQCHSFFKRALITIKYLLNIQTNYGHWDCTLINEEQAKKLSDFFNKDKEP